MEYENGINTYYSEKVIILDAGSQYGKVIDRKIRALDVESDLMPLETSASFIKEKGYRAIVISGGPGSVCAEDAPDFDKEIFKLGLPILGICYGMQLINKFFGGQLNKAGYREDGIHEIQIDTKCILFNNLESPQSVMLTHSDYVENVSRSFNVIATINNSVVGIANESLKIYGLLFHPEVDLTEHGQEMLKAFLFNVVELSGSYKLESRETFCMDYIKEAVGNKKVLMLLSGGVDSTVCAALLHKALGPKNLIFVHINNGYMRKNETAQVKQALDDLGLDEVHVLNCKFKFMYGTTIVPVDKKDNRTRHTKALCKVADPEEKRKIIGDIFIEVADQFVRDMQIDENDVVLAQGTLRPDLIESASSTVSSKADVIKTHHNDTNLVRKLRNKGRIVEPLRNFHKDEVRMIGKNLGIPSKMLDRHPFPGPGLAIRVLCGEEPYMENDFSETQVLVKIILEFENMVQKQHALLHRIENITSPKERKRLSEMSTKHVLAGTVLPIRTVGVQGDNRTYSYAVGISSQQEPATEEDWIDLFYYARIIPRVCTSVNRVCYISGGLVRDAVTDITPTYLTSVTLSTLRQADSIATQTLYESSCYNSISQMPVILIPIHFDRDIALRIPSVRRSVIIRPFVTMDFMTGMAAMPGKHIPIKVVNAMLAQLRDLPGISRSLYDLTSKPPGTIEWE